MHEARALEIIKFDHESNPLALLEKTNQSNYIKSYLKNLGALTVLVEFNYFDRDYLSEFSSFYSLSAQGYPNICKRLHFFKSEAINRDLISSAAAENKEAQDLLQENYLGFTVIRPLPSSPFGRTVLKWFDDKTPNNPRIIEPARKYKCHIGGILLSVEGIAWQQQDSGVAACASVGIWTMLHSSAFDDVHAIPTTAEITKAAHKSASLGARMFPSNYLTSEQLMESIKEHGFAPVVCSGDLTSRYFSIERLGATCSAFLRSGYPILIIGKHNSEGIGHAVCAVGFREPNQPTIEENGEGAFESGLFDSATDVLYIHDDNIGPNVRFKIKNLKDYEGREGAALVHEAPDYVQADEATSIDYPDFFPETLIVAVHEDIRISPDYLHKEGKHLTDQICAILNELYAASGLDKTGLIYSTRYIRLPDFFSRELKTILEDKPDVLSSTRLKLIEEVPPMSLHIGLIRIAIPNSDVLVDVLFDTTDTDRNRSVYAHIVYDANLEATLAALDEEIRKTVLGTSVIGY